jgi:hypothetical protein
MKKYFVIFYLLVMVRVVHSDQLAWITLEQAKQTVAYFEDKGIDEVILWCACCDNDKKILVEVTGIYYKKADDPSYYEVYIKGETSAGKKIDQPVDLAYVHIERGSKWRCLGKELKFECDPCTKSFKY